MRAAVAASGNYKFSRNGTIQLTSPPSVTKGMSLDASGFNVTIEAPHAVAVPACAPAGFPPGCARR